MVAISLSTLVNRTLSRKGSSFQIHTMQLTMVMKKETYTAKKRAIIFVDKSTGVQYFTLQYSYIHIGV